MRFRITHLGEGHSQITRNVLPEEIDLRDDENYKSSIEIVFDVEKVGHEYFVDAEIHTSASMVCDRCAEPFKADVQDHVRLIFSTDENLVEDEDDIYLINDATTEVDVTRSIRETLLISLPQKRLCSEQCKGLCPHCGANLNVETCNCQDESIDPRWEALKQLLE